jgi:hypothetical protein
MSDHIRTQSHDSLYGQRISSLTVACRILSALSHTADIWDVGHRLEAAISWPGIGMDVVLQENSDENKVLDRIVPAENSDEDEAT